MTGGGSALLRSKVGAQITYQVGDDQNCSRKNLADCFYDLIIYSIGCASDEVVLSSVVIGPSTHEVQVGYFLNSHARLM